MICTGFMSFSILTMKSLPLVNDILKLVVIIPLSAVIYFMLCLMMKVYRIDEMYKLLRSW